MRTSGHRIIETGPYAVLMALNVVAYINHGCSGQLEETTEAELARVTSQAMWHEVFSQLRST